MRVHELARELGCETKDVLQAAHLLGIEAKSPLSGVSTESEARLRAHFQPNNSETGAPGSTRVYELARELGCETKDVLQAAHLLGIEAKSPLSGVSTESEARLRAHFQPNHPETPDPETPDSAEATPEVGRPPQTAAPAPRDLDRTGAPGSMRVHELARELGCETKDVLQAAHLLGIEAKSPLSGVSTESEARLRAHFQPNDPETGAPGSTRVYELARELGCETKDVLQAAHLLGIEAKSPLSGVSTESETRLRAHFQPNDPETGDPAEATPELGRPPQTAPPAPRDLDRVTPRSIRKTTDARHSPRVRGLFLTDSPILAPAGTSIFERWTFILIVAYLVLNRVIPDRFVLPVGSSVRVYELVLVLILGVWLLWMIVDPLPFPDGLLGITSLGLLAFLAVAPFFSALEMTPFQINGAQRGLVRVVLFAGMFLAAYHLAFRLTSARLLLGWVLGLTACQAILSVWEYLTETPLYFFDDLATSIGMIPDPNSIRGEFELFTRLTGEVRAVVTAPHPIVLSALIALGVLISAGWLVHERGNKGRRWVMFATGVLLIALPVSNSRTGFVILVVAAVPFLILASRNLVRLIPMSLGVGVLLVVAFIVSPQTPRLLLNSFTNPGEDHNTQVRLSKFDSIPELIADRPFLGTGYLTHDPALQIFDNAYNLALVETGIIGLSLFVLFFGLILNRCWSAFRLASEREAIIPFAGLVASLTVLVGGATFDAWTFDQFFPTALIIMGLGAGRSAVIRRRPDRPQPETNPVGSRPMSWSH